MKPESTSVSLFVFHRPSEAHRQRHRQGARQMAGREGGVPGRLAGWGEKGEGVGNSQRRFWVEWGAEACSASMSLLPPLQAGRVSGRGTAVRWPSRSPSPARRGNNKRAAIITGRRIAALRWELAQATNYCPGSIPARTHA